MDLVCGRLNASNIPSEGTLTSPLIWAVGKVEREDSVHRQTNRQSKYLDMHDNEKENRHAEQHFRKHRT